MKRTGWFRLKRFFTEHWRLLLFLLLPLFGCFLGSLLYRFVYAAGWADQLAIERVSQGFGGAVAQWAESCFQPLTLLLVLFLAGLSVCGVPMAALVPAFWGFGVGLVQARYYADGFGGVALAAAVLLPHSAVEAVALMMGAAECFRMSVCFSSVLLPRSARCGGLWQEFRLYGIRFLLLAVILLGAGALDVIMRLLCARWL